MMGARVLAAVTVVAIGAAAALAFVTIHPPPLKVKSRAARGTAPAVPLVLPDVEAPPLPTARDWAPAPPAVAPTEPAAPGNAASSELANRPIEALRASASASDPAAMEELGRRLIQGIGVAKDQQAGAGWLLRAAEQGSAQSAFNVGVMYERGFVVERDSTKAAQWYRKAADGGVAMAKHNLALMLRDGKGVPRDGKAAIELLQSAALQGMAASMFSLGDIYDRGDAAPRDATAALAWFAITGEFERQANRGEETALARTASQRASVLQRTLTPDELKQAQEIAQAEFKRIVEALAPPKPAAAEPAEAPSGPAIGTSQTQAAAPAAPDAPIAWPVSTVDQVRAVQQALFELGLLREKPDGGLGPMTRAAIRAFQKSSGLRETSEPSKDLYVSLRLALARRDVVANSPLPAPPKESPKQALALSAPVQQELPKADLPKQEPTKQVPVKQEAVKQIPAKQEPQKQDTAKPEPVRIELARAEPPPPPNAAEFARSASKPAAMAVIDPPKPTLPAVDTAKPQSVNVNTAPPAPRIDLGRPEPPPPPPTSSEIQRLTEKTSPDAWPSNDADRIKALQRLLRDMKVYGGPIDGKLSADTRAAIREYERFAGVQQTGEPSRTLFESLKEMRALMAR